MLAYLGFQDPALLSLLLSEPRVSRRNMFLTLDMTLVKMNGAETDILSAIGLRVVGSENDVRETVLLDALRKKRRA